MTSFSCNSLNRTLRNIKWRCLFLFWNRPSHAAQPPFPTPQSHRKRFMVHLLKKSAAQAPSASYKNPKLAAGEMALKRLLALADYELEHDPYRGMLSPNSPWSQCQWLEEINDDESAAGRKVFRTCHCICPSLIEWTEKHDVQVSKRRKRKRKSTGTSQYNSVLGSRPNDPKIQCACDYNPVGCSLVTSGLIHSGCLSHLSSFTALLSVIRWYHG